MVKALTMCSSDEDEDEKAVRTRIRVFGLAQEEAEHVPLGAGPAFKPRNSLGNFGVAAYCVDCDVQCEVAEMLLCHRAAYGHFAMISAREAGMPTGPCPVMQSMEQALCRRWAAGADGCCLAAVDKEQPHSATFCCCRFRHAFASEEEETQTKFAAQTQAAWKALARFECAACTKSFLASGFGRGKDERRPDGTPRTGLESRCLVCTLHRRKKKRCCFHCRSTRCLLNHAHGSNKCPGALRTQQKQLSATGSAPVASTADNNLDPSLGAVFALRGTNGADATKGHSSENNCT